MTTYPEDAMTRERALEEAWRKRCNDPTLRNDRASFLTFKAGFEAALASTRQEPAPIANAEEVARQIIKKLNDTPDAVSSANDGGGYVPDYSIETIAPIIAAALRRYAGDGVTDEMVREFRIAFHECTMHHPNPASLPDYAVRKGLAAAARAKPSEKGGAR